MPIFPQYYGTGNAGASEPLKELEDGILQTDDVNEAKPSQREAKSELSSKRRSDDVLPTDDLNEAGPSQPEVEDESLQNVSGMDADAMPLNAQIKTAYEHVMNAKKEESQKINHGNAPDGLFYFDLGREALPPSMAPTGENVQLPRDTNLGNSSSDEEVILFKGRDAATQVSDKEKPQQKWTVMATDIQVVAEYLPKKIANDGGQDTTKNRPKHTPPREKGRKRYQKRDDDDAFLADYIANMQENGEIEQLMSPDSRNMRDLGGSQDEEDMLREATPENVLSAGTKLDSPGSHTRDNAIAKASSAKLRSVNDQYSSQSDADDEILAKLIAGQDLSDNANQAWPEEFDFSSSDSTDDKKAPQNQFDIDDFDVMDWERPSLRKKRNKKAAQSQPTFDVSDDELEQTLQAAWKNDRFKKSERKKRREELRELGMLGKNAGTPNDPRVKYPDGMKLEQVAEEIKDFLRGADQNMSFPPMDTHGRKMIHELANKFNVKSKSIGKADQRRTTLYRTNRTLPFVEGPFENAVARINRRYFPRLDTKGKRNKRPSQPGRSNDAAASYRDGEIVGAAAPELGVENRGRAMLEKMGWSEGTALGAMDNKGILQPVPQTMKKSRAGLG
ncbi:R3H domain [Geosmithia morbida]|uniref:Protein SQS1 n=1 Tax=Geosmithia morbida TaxID=1094350 RepID=A0A9P4YR52_9HYPO|nr:R3H domain [Geosmithia morbida]KAF4121583.1 R3H domain [Geosmithia morbida]